MPALLVDFTFYYVDKTTLSYAAVSPPTLSYNPGETPRSSTGQLFGIKKDLNLSGTQYSNLGSIFYM